MSRGQVLLLGLVLLTAYAYFYQGGGWNQNSRYDLARALVEHGSVRIDDYASNTGDKAIFQEHVYSDKAPGQALTALPAVGLGTLVVRVLGGDPGVIPVVTVLSYLATVLAAGLPTVIAAMCLAWSAQRLGASPGGAVFVALVYGLGTPAWAYATLLWGHALAGGCLMLAFAAAIQLTGCAEPCAQAPRGSRLSRSGLSGGSRGERSGPPCQRSAQPPAQNRTLSALLVGLSAGWAVVTEYPAAGAALVLVILAIWNAPRVWPWVLLGALLTAGVLAVYNLAAFGSVWHIGYQSVQGFPGLQQGFLGVSSPKRTVLQEILFGSFRGVLPLAPILALAPVGLVLMWRRHRQMVMAAAAISLYYLLFNASYFYWDGGFSYGPRHVGAALPFVCLGLAPLWTRANRLLRAGLVVLAAYGGVLALMAVSTTVLLPESVSAPMQQLVWPAFLRGDLALNHDLYLLRADPNAVPTSILERGAWNVGQLLGLSGHVSLLPLGVAWLLAGLGWLRVRSTGRGVASPASEPEAVRLPVVRPPSLW